MGVYSNRINVVAIAKGLQTMELTITNTQNVSVPSGLQVMATVPLTFKNYTIDFDKIGFYYNGNPVYSWVESVSGGNMTVWLKMPVSIPANSSIKINAIPYAKTVLDGNYWGCAPQLTSTYGQYDNGASVFNNYWNFAGTTLPNGWQTIASGYSINNGLIFSAVSNANQGIGTTFAVATPGLLEIYATGNYGRIGLELSTSNTTFFDGERTWYENGYGMIYGGYVSPPDGFFARNLGSSQMILVNFESSTPMPQVFGVGWVSTGNEREYTYQNPLSPITILNSDNAVAIANNLYIYVGQGESGSTQQGGNWTVYWLRTRAYPPNGVMPTVSVSSIPVSVY